MGTYPPPNFQILATPLASNSPAPLALGGGVDTMLDLIYLLQKFWKKKLAVQKLWS